MTIKVELTESEIMQAGIEGVIRHIRGRRGLAQLHGIQADNAWQCDIEAALGELAFAKALGVYWNGGHLRANDVEAGGKGWRFKAEVRTRSRHHYALIVRDRDPNDRAVVLVTGIDGMYQVRGWIWARDGKQPQWIQTHGGREPAYFVPQSSLRDPLELLEWFPLS